MVIILENDFRLKKVSTTIYPVGVFNSLLDIYCTIYPVTIYCIIYSKRIKLILGRQLIINLGRKLVDRLVDTFLNIWVETVDSFRGGERGNMFGGDF